MIDECGQILETLKGHAAELLQITDPEPRFRRAGKKSQIGPMDP